MESFADRVNRLSTGQVGEILFAVQALPKTTLMTLTDWERVFIVDQIDKIRTKYPSPKVIYYIAKIAGKLKLPIVKKLDIEPDQEDKPSSGGPQVGSKYDIICKTIKLDLNTKLVKELLGKQWGWDLIEGHRDGKFVSPKMAVYIDKCVEILHPWLSPRAFSAISDFIDIKSTPESSFFLCPEWCMVANAICVSLVAEGKVKETKLMRLLSEYSRSHEKSQDDSSASGELNCYKPVDKDTAALLSTTGAMIKALIDKLKELGDEAANIFSDVLADFRPVYRNGALQEKLLATISVKDELHYPKRIKAIAHRCLQYLAGVCDFAREDDGHGFNKLDAMNGHMLADLAELEDKHMSFAVHCARFYRKQLSGCGANEVLEYHKKLLSGIKQEDDDEECPANEPDNTQLNFYIMLRDIIL